MRVSVYTNAKKVTTVNIQPCRKQNEKHPEHSVTGYSQLTGNSTLVTHLCKHHPWAYQQFQDLQLGPDGQLGKSFQSMLEGHVEKHVLKVPFSAECLALAIFCLIAACDLVCDRSPNKECLFIVWQPISLVDQDKFRDLIQVLKPDIHPEDMPGCKAIAELVMRQYESENAAMIECLKAAPGCISGTVDCWSSDPMESYIGITGHYIVISEVWSLEEELLGFKVIRGPHSGENLVEYVMQVIEELGIEHKVCPITWWGLQINLLCFSLGGSQLTMQLITTP